MRLYRSIFFLYFILLPQLIVAQQQAGNFMAYGPETRYLSGMNSGVYQSRSGYLWICTGNGLIRFDGKRHVIFSADHANPNSLTDNAVWDITEDKNGDLWIAGFVRGVTKYNQRSGRFKKYPVLCQDGNPIFGIYSIFNDAAQNLWFATAGRGLAQHDFEKDSFHFYYPEPNAATDGTVRGDNFVTSIAQDPFHKNILWLGSFHGLFSFDKQTKQFQYYQHPNLDAPNNFLINDIEMQANGMLWIGSWGEGMHAFDVTTKKFSSKKIPLFSKVVYSIKAVNNNSLYTACLSGGLFEYRIDQNTAVNITPVANAADEKNFDIQRISITADAGIFAGGKFYIYQQHQNYSRLKKNIILPGIDTNSIHTNGIAWDDFRKKYWVSTYKNLYSISQDKKSIKLYTTEADLQKWAIMQKIVVDGWHNVWALCRSKGLYLYNDAKDKFLKAASMPMQDSLIKNIRSIATDAKGMLWMFGSDSIYYYDAPANKIVSAALQWGTGFTGRRSIIGPQLVASPGNEMWLLSQQGIFIFNKNGFVKHIYKTGLQKNDLASQFVMIGTFSKSSRSFWFSSGDGLQVMNDSSHAIFSTQSLSNGLPANTIRGIASDDPGRIWLASISGLGFWDPATQVWRNFNRLDGLETDYLDTEIFALPGNIIAIPQRGGLAIYPDTVLLTPNKARLRITGILVNNNNYADTVLPEFVQSLELPYNKNNIIIDYAAMDWVYPFKTNYLYKLEGVEGLQTWIPNEEARLNLVGLQPGKYKLHLKALNSGGAWTNEIVLPITIHPPFYKTWWFITLVFLVLLGGGYLLFRFRIMHINKMQNMRNDISRNLHDDIGASLSNIGILNELVKRNLNQDETKAKEYLNRAAEDIQHISENLGDIVWNINPMFDDINNLLIRMKRYAADMAEGKNIHCVFDLPENAAIQLPMDKRRDFYLMYKEAVNNMVKHSAAKNAFIKITVAASRLNLLIEDDGKGFDETVQKEGNGLFNMRQRASQLSGKLSIEAASGKGTRIQFSMPV